MLISKMYHFSLPRVNWKKFLGVKKLKLAISWCLISSSSLFCQSWKVCVRVNYDKDQFQHLIDEFVRDIIKEVQSSKLSRYHWPVKCSLCEESSLSFLSFFVCRKFFVLKVQRSLSSYCCYYIYSKVVTKKWLLRCYLTNLKKIVKPIML